MIETLPYNLGCVKEVDERDKQYGVELLLAGAQPKIKRRTWTIGPVLDQGRTNSCVGYSWEQFLQCTPLKTMTGPSAMDIYTLARRLDDDPTNDNLDEGTSVRAGAQALTQYGRMKTYLWATTIDEATRWLLTHGPIVMGTVWHQGMFYPNIKGNIIPQGPIVGRHAWLLYGYDVTLAMFKGVTSWGTGFGLGGSFYIDMPAFTYLVNEGADMCTATEKRVTIA